MFEQLTQLVQQFGNEAIVNNNAIPNHQNEAVMNEASSSILGGLQKIASEGGLQQLAGLFQGNNAIDSSNSVVQQLSQQLVGSLGEKFGISSAAASGVAASLIPSVLGSLIGKAKDPNDSSLQISDLVNAISGGSGNSGLMDAVNAMTKSSGGIGGLLGKLFG